MTILVTAGTGTVGSQVVAGLLGRGVRPRVLTRSEEHGGQLPAGAKGFVGNLDDPASLSRAMSACDGLVLITPLTRTETQEGLAAVDAAKRAGVSRIVFMSVHEVESCPEAPHFKSKIDIEAALADSRIPHTVVMPDNFFQNDYWVRDVIVEHGIYPHPIGHVGTHRVDVRDIAEAIVTAMVENGHEGQRYPLIGPDLLTGDASAEMWTRHLGRPVRYAGDDLEAWARQASQAMPEWLVRDLKIMYGHFQKRGLKATPRDFDVQARVLRHPPRSYDAFVRETARAWSR